VAVSVIVFIVLISWFKNKTKKAYKKWDLNTKTIADYTLHYKIDERLYEHYEKEIFQHENHENINYGFSCYLKREIERLLRLKTGGVGTNGKEMRIA